MQLHCKAFRENESVSDKASQNEIGGGERMCCLAEAEIGPLGEPG
jgi:hypothetical protein